ncbi:tetraacyldisaccharide 4'-kinase [Mucilaginibacter sp. BJC16-A38]|uniref:tetraacyldisaccharide 4'-kinase n=1 Tax=Mucilaginibacter phenanthrenivorans TaxID=1234842 RepID=UPI0021581257|nr:tetraacyldisaccharide 4'-kinase [Mucilaginibacter phenanthrenivorans]MCR8561405.1 tetraacyldisaccharide 4'-kinase [Mucilaginibacter phenanthrenivorans]
MKYLRWLLLPFSLIYGLVVIMRNWFYDAGLFKSYRFTKPIISVGNLEVGGAGKSPMTEYLIRLLKSDYKLATLSRGYGRKTKGYLVLSLESEVLSQESGVKNQESPVTIDSGLNTQVLRLSSKIGDEPAQFKQKFPDITVAVCEDRVYGLNKLLPNHDLILMDDAYQHRAVQPGFSILLFDYTRINQPHFLLPAGNMREPMSGRWRAQVIIISKCPPTLTNDELNALAYKIEPLPYQSLFFTSIAYQQLSDLQGNPVAVPIDGDTTVFLLTGIANPKPLLQHLQGSTSHIIHHNYPDHHLFTLKNISKLAAEFAAHPSQKKIIVTTEKDAQRLDESWLNAGLSNGDTLPVFMMPIRVEFLNGNGPQFDKIILDYVREHSENHIIH